MHQISLFGSYTLGEWCVQQTIYSLLSNKVTNNKLNKITEKSKRNKCLRDIEGEISDRAMYLSRSSKNGKLNSNNYIILQCQNQDTRVLNNIIVLNTESNIPIKKHYYFNPSNVLTIKSGCLRLSVIEKFWSINQNLVLCINIIQYRANIISIIFESRIRI